MKKTIFIFLMIFGVTNLWAENDIYYNEIELPKYLDPVYGGRTIEGTRCVSLMFRDLYGYDRARAFINLIAESDPVITPEKNLIVTLKPNMLWHNNQSVTAKNVIRSVEILKHPGTEFPAKNELKRFTAIERDERTIEFVNVNSNHPITKFTLAFPILPTDYLSSVSLAQNSPFTMTKPIGNGPFYLEALEKNRIIFRRFDEYARATKNGETTDIDRIICLRAKERSFWVDDLISKKVQMLVDVPQIQINMLKGLQDIMPVQYPNYSMEMLAFNMSNKLLSEKFIRLAMLYGTDRENFINSYLSGNADLITGPYPANSFYDWQEAEVRKYNPESARKLLEDAGCVKNPSDGIYRFNNQKLSFRILYVNDDDLAQTGLADDFAKQMKEIGIEIKEPTWKDYQGYLKDIEQNNYDIVRVTIHYNEVLDISDTYRSKGAMNFMSYDNTIVNGLFDQLKSSNDPIQKQLIGNQIHKAIYDDPPAIFLWTRKSYAAYNTMRIANFSVHPQNFFYLVDEWRYIK
jgi:peptide/nickel transport system substrate-binding protein